MIWVIGSNGMLGQEVVRQLESLHLPFVQTGREVDITKYDSLSDFAKSVETSSYFPSKLPREHRQIKWIINCAAYTAVDKAEEEEETARAVNYEGALNIARISRQIGAKLIHISSDYVFDGKASSPYTEDSPKSPLGVYGSSKSDGEDAIEKEMTLYYIIRTSWLYGFNGKNFVYSILDKMKENDSVQVVNDQKGCPTFAGDLAGIIIKFIEKSENAKSLFGKNKAPSYGIYNYTNEGETTWFDFANEIYRLAKKHGRIKNNCEITGCSSDEYETKAERPKYSVLSKEKIVKELKIKIPSWQTSLERFIKNSKF